MSSDNKWRFWIDRGGTFTDIIGRAPNNHLLMDKRPSSEPHGAARAIRTMLDLPAGARIPAKLVAEIRIGSTIATNALLERKGAPFVIAVTRGFADALLIGDQTRPHLFALDNPRPPPLWQSVVEIDERIGADGRVVLPLNIARARASFAAAAKRGIDTAAIALMHGFLHPRHEKMLATIARQSGMRHVVMSNQAAPFIKLIPRAHTAAADAYLHAAVQSFADSWRQQCEPKVRLLFMQSNGALIDARSWRAVNAVLSGPAGGAVGARVSAKMAGFNKVIGFDMGGTSTDVCTGDSELRLQNKIGGAPIFSPMLDIHTVAAGGGSIVRQQDGRLLIGPKSAGAAPGPACYRNGGPLTITDCNVMLGRLQPDYFPALFGKNCTQLIDADIVRKKFCALLDDDVNLKTEKINRKTINGKIDKSLDKTESKISALAEGFVQVAVEHMAAAARRISIARGINPAACVMNSFGGAAGQHICQVADAVGANGAVASRYASVLSAWGIGMADIGAVRRQTAECDLSSPLLKKMLDSLEKQARSAMPKESQNIKEGGGDGRDAVQIQRNILCRYAGVEMDLPVPYDSPARMRAAFERKHKKLCGFADKQRAVIAAAAEVQARICTSPLPSIINSQKQKTKPIPRSFRAVFFGGKSWQTPFYDWQTLPEKATLIGPAIVIDKWNTVVIDPGWRAVNINGALKLQRETKSPHKSKSTKNIRRSNAAMLEIFNNRFMAAAEQMGETLARTATSVNIRERMDFSCAVFDKRGRLLANAPHIPVHLGSMGDSVRYLIRQAPEGILRGDSYMLNSPYHGGTHLPDVTVMRGGRLDGKNGVPDFYIAARGHHADIGGISAGSMPADSKHISEEGVLITLRPAAANGRLLEKEIRALLLGAEYPARNADQNLLDLRAQLAALETGLSEIRRAGQEFGIANTLSYMQLVQNSAARASRRLLATLQSGSSKVVLDDGAIISVLAQTNVHEISEKSATSKKSKPAKISKTTTAAIFDFSGTSKQHPTNFNAPKSVVYAAVIYCLRVLLGSDMPLNDGIMRPVRLIIPKSSMLNPRPPAAVAAGNVEVSQNIVDAVFTALGICAHAQGTCNNFTLGAGGKQYYETICGGGGATPTNNGADAMQVHMTNSRASDPEILEIHYPLRLEEFSFRKKSGGGGKHRGGMGAIRKIKFLTKGEASILSSRRQTPPRGLNGGKDGKCGKNTLIRANGKQENLKGCAHIKMNPNDIFIIETPGGGGWGKEGK